jgi:hypothetical protein
MTTTPAQQPPANPRSAGRSKGDAIIEKGICALGWATQAAAAAVYLTVMATSPAWPTMPIVSRVLHGLFVLCAVPLWGLCLYAEQQNFYDREKSSLFRKAGLFTHLCLLTLAALAASSFPNSQRVGIWFVLGFCLLMAPIIWHAWMHTQYLHPEDQAVIDALKAREAKMRAAAHDARERELRRDRLNAVAASIGYEFVEQPAEPQSAPTPPSSQPATWAVPPGKHDPLVYFIRNGNRLKIGTTTELKRRIRTLALRPENVALLISGGRQLERAFHRQFADLRIGNSEWFAYDGPLVDFVTTENNSRKDSNQ